MIRLTTEDGLTASNVIFLEQHVLLALIHYAQRQEFIPTTTSPEPEFPEGQLTPEDEGQLEVAIAADPKRNVVVIRPRKPFKWAALEPPYVRALAAILLNKADELDPPK
jgi:hypothetical protein